MARHRYKDWQNGRGGRWTTRIVWYEETRGQNIRLEIEDSERCQNLYPEDDTQATFIWDQFKNLSPKVEKWNLQAPEACGVVAKILASSLINSTTSKETNHGTGN